MHSIIYINHKYRFKIRKIRDHRIFTKFRDITKNNWFIDGAYKKDIISHTPDIYYLPQCFFHLKWWLRLNL